MAWTGESKIATTYERGRILTPDEDQILVGASEDEVLIHQEEETEWSFQDKTSS